MITTKQEIMVPTVKAVQRQLDYYTNQYISNNPKSRALNQEGSNVLPGGTTRAVLVHQPFPIGFDGGKNCYLTSVDGHEYLDFVSEYCAGMCGHTHPEVIETITKVMESGFTLGGPIPAEVELAKALVARFPSLDSVRFCNSGTEANMFAIATGLHYSGRKKVLVFENGYHGGCLSFARSSPMTLPHHFVYGKYNDVKLTSSKIDMEIGVIIVEPLQFAGGLIMATKEFLQFLRSEATRIGAVLIFDEVVTSRLEYGGLQSFHNITPDMTTLGKHFGGGFSFGAFGGRREIMELFNPQVPQSLYHSGTWNNNVFSMSAGLVAIKLLSAENLERINQLGDRLREGINKIASARHSGQFGARGIGSLVGIGFEGPNASIYQDLLYFYLLHNRIYIGHRGFLALNITHRGEHVDRVLDVLTTFCDTVIQ